MQIVLDTIIIPQFAATLDGLVVIIIIVVVVVVVVAVIITTHLCYRPF